MPTGVSAVIGQSGVSEGFRETSGHDAGPAYGVLKGCYAPIAETQLVPLGDRLLKAAPARRLGVDLRPRIRRPQLVKVMSRLFLRYHPTWATAPPSFS